MEEFEFMNVFKGKRIKLILKNSTYVGVLQRINPNKTLVLSDDSRSDGCGCSGSKLFFGREILNVEFVKAADTDKENTSVYKPEEDLNVEKFPPYNNSVESYEEENVNFVVIDNFQDNFGPALMDIQKQQVIGVGADGVGVFNHGRLCWLQMSTKRKVYLFDIVLLGVRAFKNGLTMILENKHILKIIHDCRAIAGCLNSQFGIRLANVFDTQVADVMCFYSETGGFLPNRVSTLEEVLSLRLKMPSSQLISLQIKSKLAEKEWEIWQKRPCPVPLLRVMALSVIHLLPLRLVLVDTLMMDYVTLVASYLDSSYFEPDELQHESMLELPTQLRKLEQMRSDRQKWASDHYPVTEQGLLARFNPRIQSPARTSPVEQQHSQLKADPFGSGTTESHSSTDTEIHNPPPSPVTVSSGPSVDVHISSNTSPTLLNSTIDMAGVLGPAGVGRGCTHGLVNMRRGKPCDEELSPTPALPAVGRGFLLQVSKAPMPAENREENSSLDGDNIFQRSPR
ncbi:piRNA biogenesis protein EXD1 [Antennarius striatus]|uniref:piRNA biogenesis protein EXD1 n=1 Tax=Antennarius striatus TaxID=241820 RepID=UPI0035AE61FC